MNRHKLFTALAISFSAALGLAPSISSAQNYASIQRGASISPRELDSLLAPIALYPDQLLGDVLMAATYPQEVAEAADWMTETRNASLRGNDLADELDDLDWDPSVKALTTVPGILQMMVNRMDWTERLGDAFIAQELDVTDSIQRLRHQAYDVGRLRSDSHIRVAFDGDEIIIEPGNPGSLYFSVYDPREMYGYWQYPDYPPIYLPPPVGYGIATGFSYGIFIPIVEPLWGWQRWDWRNHRIHIDARRFNYINRYHRNDHPPVSTSVWRHDPSHRHDIRTSYGRPDRFDNSQRDNNRADGRRFERNNDSRDNRRDNNSQERTRENWRGRGTPQASAPNPNVTPPADSQQRDRRTWSQRDNQPGDGEQGRRESRAPRQMTPPGAPGAPAETARDQDRRQWNNNEPRSSNAEPPERWQRRYDNRGVTNQGNFKGDRNTAPPVVSVAPQSAPAQGQRENRFEGRGAGAGHAPQAAPEQPQVQPQQNRGDDGNDGQRRARGGRGTYQESDR